MNATHDWHRISRTGFKGLDRIARERRIDAFLVRLGENLIWFFIGFAIAEMCR